MKEVENSNELVSKTDAFKSWKNDSFLKIKAERRK